MIDSQHDDKNCSWDPCRSCRYGDGWLSEREPDGDPCTDEVSALREALADRDALLALATRAVRLLRRECGKSWMAPDDMHEMAEITYALRDRGIDV